MNSVRILSAIVFIAFVGCATLRPKPQFRAERVNATATALSIEERRLVEEIRSFLGTPYLWGGSTKRGSDCSGFVMAVFKHAIGIELPHSAKEMYKLGRFVHPAGLHLGDLVFFKDVEKPGLSHVGIYIVDAKFAHASVSKGVTISSLRDKYFKNRFVAAKRIVSFK